jgi:hypothetical protein
MKGLVLGESASPSLKTRHNAITARVEKLRETRQQIIDGLANLRAISSIDVAPHITATSYMQLSFNAEYRRVTAI